MEKSTGCKIKISLRIFKAQILNLSLKISYKGRTRIFRRQIAKIKFFAIILHLIVHTGRD